METKKISGRFLPKDEHGYLVNDSALCKISSDFMPLVSDVKEIIIQQLADTLHSIYLSGSIPRGMAKPYKSDLDIYAILKPGFREEALPLIKKTCDQLLKKNNIVSKIDVELWSFKDVFPIARGVNKIQIKESLSIFDIILKNSSLCIYGDDLSHHIPLIKPGIALANDELIVIHDDISEAIKEILSAQDTKDIKYWCRRVMKNIIRAGFCLCIPIIQEQTRDIDLSADVFSTHYPDLDYIAKQAVIWIENPSSNSAEIIQFLKHDVVLFLEKVNQWMDNYNPHRLQELNRNYCSNP